MNSTYGKLLAIRGKPWLKKIVRRTRSSLRSTFQSYSHNTCRSVYKHASKLSHIRSLTISHFLMITSSVRPKHPFCVSAETEMFRPVAEPKHRNVSAEPKQSSNFTIPRKSEYYIKHFTTHSILHQLKKAILVILNKI